MDELKKRRRRADKNGFFWQKGKKAYAFAERTHENDCLTEEHRCPV
jgi:hypothetical protein